MGENLMSYKIFANNCYDWISKHPVLSICIALTLLFTLTSFLPDRSGVVPGYFDGEIINTLESGGNIDIRLCEGYFNQCKEVFKTGHQMITQHFGEPPAVKKLIKAEAPGDTAIAYTFWGLTLSNQPYILKLSFHFIDGIEPTKAWVELNMTPVK